MPADRTHYTKFSVFINKDARGRPTLHQLHAIYEGNYTDGRKAGTGKMTYPNGDVYTGEWKDNVMEGEGTYVYKVGTRRVQVAGKRVGVGCCRKGAGTGGGVFINRWTKTAHHFLHVCCCSDLASVDANLLRRARSRRRPFRWCAERSEICSHRIAELVTAAFSFVACIIYRV